MKTRWLVLLTAAVLLVQVPQKVSGQTAPESAAARCLIEGRVVSAATGEPLKKVAIILATTGRGRGRSTTTNDQGQFSFRSLDPGGYRLIAVRTGYVRQAYGDRTPGPYVGGGGTVLNLRVGQEMKDILFRLVPAGAITGRVVDEDGEPLMEVQIQALRWNYVRGRRQLTPAGGAHTNDRGEYRIYNISPGRYYLCATYEGGYVGGYMSVTSGDDVSASEQGYAPVFYPGIADPSQAAAVELRGGEDVSGINFMLVPQHTVHVSGRVFNAVTGQPARAVHVTVMGRSLTMRAWLSGDHDTTSDDQGMFHFRGILPGSYIVEAQWDGGPGQGPGTVITNDNGQRTVQYSRTHYSGRQQFEVGAADVEGLNLTIAPGTDVAGTLKVEGTLALNTRPPQASGNAVVQRDRDGNETVVETVTAGGRTMMMSRSNQMRVVLEPIDDISLGNYTGAIKGDNTFSIGNVPEGTYRVNINGMPEGAYLKSARMGGQDVLESGLIMTRGRRGSLDLVISAAAGRLDGTTLDSDGKPFMGARVVLVPDGDRRKIPNLYRTTSSDQYGRFTMRSVPPGDYKLFAWESVEAGAYQDAEFMRPYEDQGQVVHVTEGGETTAELKVISTENRGQ